MKIAVFGGTGFVGSYIINELNENGMIPRAMVRKGSKQKIDSTSEIVNGGIDNLHAVNKTIESTEAVIYNIGIIREYPTKGITFDKLHFQGVQICIKAALEVGVKRFILMSANGAKQHGTGYQSSKWKAEEELKASGLDWTIFKPSLIFGDPGGYGKPEFCTKLRDDMLSLPIPAPLFYSGILPIQAGSFRLSPIHVSNVAQFFVKAINMPESIRKTFELGGMKSPTWKEIIHQIALASGKLTWKMPAPVFGIKIVVALFEEFEWFPVTRDQISMLIAGNTVDKYYFNDFSIKAIPFEADNLSYLKN